MWLAAFRPLKRNNKKKNRNDNNQIILLFELSFVCCSIIMHDDSQITNNWERPNVKIHSWLSHAKCEVLTLKRTLIRKWFPVMFAIVACKRHTTCHAILTFRKFSDHWKLNLKVWQFTHWVLHHLIIYGK